MNTIQVKTFNDLSAQELYNILQLRSEIFVVEQNCVYQDLDGKDEKALHVIGSKNNQVVAYARIFNAGDYFKEASIGRIAVKDSERKYGYGQDIVKASIKAVADKFGETTIHLSAQSYLKKFYSSFGFKEVGEEYLEDDIPHIGMVKSS